MTTDRERHLADCELALIATERERNEALACGDSEPREGGRPCGWCNQCLLIQRDNALALAHQADKATAAHAEDVRELVEARAEATRLAAALRAITDGLRVPRPEADQIGFAYDEAITALAAAPQATVMVEAVREAVCALGELFALVEAGDLVRNTARDGEGGVFVAQELRIVRALKHAREALGDPALKEWMQ